MTLTEQQLLDQVAEGRTFDDWIADPCFGRVFGAVRDTIHLNFEECAVDPDGIYELKLLLRALQMVESASREFVKRGALAQSKVKALRDKEQREIDRTRRVK